MKFQLALSAAALLALASFTPACHEHHHSEEDTQSPSLSISKPIGGQIIQGSVQIALHATDETSLHTISIKVTKDSDGSTVFEAAPVVHDETEFIYDETFTPAGLSADTPMTLTVELEDHAEHKVAQTVNFTAKL